VSENILSAASDDEQLSNRRSPTFRRDRDIFEIIDLGAYAIRRVGERNGLGKPAKYH